MVFKTDPRMRDKHGVMATPLYVHGYDEQETQRLHDQADLLRELVHTDTSFPDGRLILEVGCGVGAQTALLARKNSHARIVAIDRSARSLQAAQTHAHACGLANIDLYQADVLALPFAAERFDHVFGSFLLEHLSRPLDALRSIARVMKPHGTVTLVEGDHGSVVVRPMSDAASQAIACQAGLQRRAGGDPNVGRQLSALLESAGFHDIQVTPLVMRVDGDRRHLAGRVDRTFVRMIDGVRNQAVHAGIITARAFDAGIADLRRAIQDGEFSYTFFKAHACTTDRRP